MAMPFEARQASPTLQMEQVLIGPVPRTVSAPTPEEEAPTVEPNDLGEYELWRFELTELTNRMLAQLPQYIYRVTSDKSQGTNRPGFYQAGAIVGNLGHANFFAYSKNEIRQTLQDHIRTKPTLSHWISSTGSIRLVLEFGLRMKENAEKAKRDRRKNIESKKQDVAIMEEEGMMPEAGDNIRIHMIDTTRLTKRSLIVHAYSMLQTYGVRLNANLSYNQARLKTSWNEFLIWDELVGAAGSIAFDDLLYPKISKHNFQPPGLLDLMPNLGTTPKEGSWSKFRKAKNFSQYYGLQEKIQLYDLASKSLLSAKDYGSWRGWERRSSLPIPKDARVPLDEWHLLDYVALVENMPGDFQFPLVVHLLSMRTDFINKESMLEGLTRLPEVFPGDPRFANLSFWSTTLRPDAKVDVQLSEELLARACADIAGIQAVSFGPRHDHRKILRVDSDPEVADTTTECGSGPATMALAFKCRWYGLRTSRPTKLKARLLYKRLIEEGIDEDIDETEAQLNRDEGVGISADKRKALNDLISESCRKRRKRQEKLGGTWYMEDSTAMDLDERKRQVDCEPTQILHEPQSITEEQRRRVGDGIKDFTQGEGDRVSLSSSE